MKEVFLAVFVLAFVSGCSPSNENAGPPRASFSYGSEESRPEKTSFVERIQSASQVYRALSESPDQEIPMDLINKAKCVAVIPNLIKAAFLIGGRYGQGIVSCRDVFGNWSPPAFLTLTGGSLGWQIGAQSTDLVLFFMDEKSFQSLFARNATLGGDVSVAAGPLGRTAGLGADLQLKGIYSYARSEGFFAGISLEGAVLLPDEKANAIFYDRVVSPRDILHDGDIAYAPTSAKEFMDLLPEK